MVSVVVGKWWYWPIATLTEDELFWHALSIGAGPGSRAIVCCVLPGHLLACDCMHG